MFTFERIPFREFSLLCSSAEPEYVSCGAVVILVSGCEVEKLAIFADVVVWKEVNKKMVVLEVKKKMVVFSGRLSR